MIAVDASIWISRLIVKDAHHPVTRPWLEAWVREGGLLVAPVLLLAEVAGAAARRSGRTRLGERAINDVLLNPAVQLVDLDGALAEEAAQLAAVLRLRGAGAIYVAVARRFDVPLVTWDRGQRERAAGVVDVREPAVSLQEGGSG